MNIPITDKYKKAIKILELGFPPNRVGIDFPELTINELVKLGIEKNISVSQLAMYFTNIP